MVAITPIPSYPQATSLNGAELLVGVQSGTTVRLTTAQIAALSQQLYPLQGLRLNITTIAAAYNVLATDVIIVASTSSGVPTFPNAVQNANLAFIFKNNSGSPITPATYGGQTIDGSAPASLANHGVLRIFSIGTNDWQTW